MTNKPLSLSSAEFNQHVHTHFAWMRQNAPVYRARFMFQDAYLVTRYADVAALLKDPRLVKNAGNAKSEQGKRADSWMPSVVQSLQHNMLNTDEPDHRRLRNIVHKAFTPRMIQQLEPKIERITQRLLDQAIGRQIEFVEGFALPLPVTVIAEMVGIPERDRPKFLKWTSRVLASFSVLGVLRIIPAVLSIMRYTRKLAAKRRADPQDDLLTALVQAEDEGEKLTEEEIVAMVFLLITAGYETTVSLLSNGLFALLQNPDQFAMLKADHGLLNTAIEELLRYDSPIVTTELSYAREEIELHGVTIPKGKIILPAIGSANRDESVFEHPNTLDITRQPNKHLAFGMGIHYCLGAPLARLEAKVAFTALLERCPELRLTVAPSEIQYRNVPIVHRVERLPVAW